MKHIAEVASATALGLSLIGLYLAEQRRRGAATDENDDEEPRSPAMSKDDKRKARFDALVLERGQAGTKDYRVHVLETTSSQASEVCLWHDVPLVAAAATAGAPALNFVCEIPKCTRKKFEVATTEGATPIKQDEKKGVLREFKKGDIFFNYGCFPRTWEDPNHVPEATGYPGDNDPLDVCEIGLRQIQTGGIRAVKVLGVLAMIDDDETDWKVVVIDAEDRWASELNDVADVERLLPGTISLIREWFRTYKIPDGKPPNKFALGEKCMSAEYAYGVVRETHGAYRKLLASGGHDELHLPREPSALRELDRDGAFLDELCPPGPVAVAA